MIVIVYTIPLNAYLRDRKPETQPWRRWKGLSAQDSHQELQLTASVSPAWLCWMSVSSQCDDVICLFFCSFTWKPHLNLCECSTLPGTLSIKNSSWLPQQCLPSQFLLDACKPWVWCVYLLFALSVRRLQSSLLEAWSARFGAVLPSICCFSLPVPCYLLLFLLLAPHPINPLIQNQKQGYCSSFLDHTEYTFGTRSISFTELEASKHQSMELLAATVSAVGKDHAAVRKDKDWSTERDQRWSVMGFELWF